MTSNNLKNQNETFKEFFQVKDDGNLICSAPETYFPAISCDTITATTQVISNIVISDYSVNGEVNATGDVIAYISTLSPISLKNVSDLLTITTNSRLDLIDSLNNTQNSRLDLIDILNNTQNTRLNLLESVDITQNSRLDLIDILNNTQNTRLNLLDSVDITQNSRLQNLEDLITGSSALVNDISELKFKTNYISSTSSFNTQILGTLKVNSSGGDEDLGEIDASYKITSGFSMDAPYINARTQMTTFNLTVLNNGTIEYEDDEGLMIPIYTVNGSFEPSENASISNAGVITGTKLILNDSDAQIDGETGHASLISVGAQTLTLSKDLKLANLATTQLSTLSAVKGSTVYNIDDNKINVYDGEAWGEVGGGGLVNPIYSELAMEQIQIQNGVDVGVKFDQPRPIPTYSGVIRGANSQSDLDFLMGESIDGDIIQVQSNIELTSSFVINKNIKLTALTPNLYISMNVLNGSTINITSEGSLIQGITIRSLGTGSNETCLNYNNLNANNNYVDNVSFIADEFAIITNNNQIQITNCTFNYARAPAGESQRYIALNATKGITFINNNVFNGSSPSANGTQCISTANSLTSNFINGKIYVQNNLALNNPVQRLFMNEVSLTGTNISFYFTGNQMKTSSGFVIFYQSPALGGIKEIWALDNIETLLTANTGKGIIGLDFPSGTHTINQNVKINARNNEPGDRRADYSNGSTELNVLCYLTARFTPLTQLLNTEYFDNLYLKNKLYSNLDEIPIEYLTNITSDVQTQLNGKIGSSFFNGISSQFVKGNGVIESMVNTDLPSNIDASKIANGSVSNTEFQYLDGLTSGIQTQLDGKLSLTGGTLTGAITSNSNIATTGNFNCNNAVIGGNLTVMGETITANSTINNFNGYVSIVQNPADQNNPALRIVQTGGVLGPIMEVEDGDTNIIFSINQDCNLDLNGKFSIISSSGNTNIKGLLSSEGGIENTGLISTTGNIICSGTGAVALPSGNTSTRPTPQNGMIRYNSQLASFEGYASNAWGALGGGGGFNPTISNLFLGDSLYYDGSLWRNGYYTLAPVVSVSNLTVSVNNLVSPYTWNGSSSMQMRIFVYTDSGRTSQVVNSPFTVNANTKTFTFGTGNELPDYETTYYLSVQVRPNIASYPNTFSPLTNSTLITPSSDAIQAQLTTSLSAYNSASVGAWVNITQAEYTAICNNVSGVNLGGFGGGGLLAVNAGWPFGQGAGINYGAWYNANTSYTAPCIDNSYLIAIRFVGRVDGSYATSPRVGFTSPENSLNASTNYVNFSIPSISNGINYYQCRKAPSSLTISNKSGLAQYPSLVQDAGVGLTSPFMCTNPSIAVATNTYWFTTSGTITNGSNYTLTNYSPTQPIEYIQYALTRTKSW